MVGRMLTERMNKPAAKKRNEGFQIVGVSSLTPPTGPVARFPHGASRPQVLLHLPVSFLGGNSRLIQAHLADQFFGVFHAFSVAGISAESKPGMPALQRRGRRSRHEPEREPNEVRQANILLQHLSQLASSPHHSKPLHAPHR